MENEIFETLSDFVIKQSCVDDEPITRDTELKDDLGVDGDDGVEFIIEFGRVFNVDVSNFLAAQYFHPEGGGLFFGLDPGVDVKKITVGHLEKAIFAGRLDEQIMTS
jgi:acyl carrier protein